MKFDTDAGLYTPAPDDELEQRRRLLAELGLGEADPEFDQYAADLARAAGTPYAMVNLITDEQVFVGLHCPAEDSGGDAPPVGRTMSRDHGYCPDVLDRRAPLVLPDVLAYPRFAGNAVVDQIGIRTYAGAPLIHQPTGTVLGTVCVVGPTPQPLSTGNRTLDVIKEHRDAVMARVYERAGRTPRN
ncbi:GAF domain-containing protein [Streptomyces sp. NPDC046977]|uniref:GAF domain-containing protein n=1 Tax=Streptomyces sp. NPDC046977 TaxID=3154703 RepID=UPI00340A9A9F